MEKGYRLPHISEFVQDFEFEVASDSRIVFLDDPDSMDINKNPTTRTWQTMKVYWMHKDYDVITEEYEGNTITMSGKTANFFVPFNIEVFLEKGLIRVKMTKNELLTHYLNQLKEQTVYLSKCSNEKDVAFFDVQVEAIKSSNKEPNDYVSSTVLLERKIEVYNSAQNTLLRIIKDAQETAAKNTKRKTSSIRRRDFLSW